MYGQTCSAYGTKYQIVVELALHAVNLQRVVACHDGRKFFGTFENFKSALGLIYLGCYDFKGENPLQDKTARQCEAAAFSFASPRLFFGLQSQGMQHLGRATIHS